MTMAELTAALASALPFLSAAEAAPTPPPGVVASASVRMGPVDRARWGPSRGGLRGRGGPPPAPA